LEDAKGRWADELHSISWDFQTSSMAPIEETPFNLTFCTEALIPVEIKEPKG